MSNQLREGIALSTIHIYFDGGTIAKRSTPEHDWYLNPVKQRPAIRTYEIQSGDGYGSWHVEWNGFNKQVLKIPFVASKIGQPGIDTPTTENAPEFNIVTPRLGFHVALRASDCPVSWLGRLNL